MREKIPWSFFLKKKIVSEQRIPCVSTSCLLAPLYHFPLLNKKGTTYTDCTSEQALRANMAFLKEKITLLCFMQLVFERAADDRIIAFADISKAVCGWAGGWVS